MNAFTEYTVEAATLDWFAELGYETLHGPDIAPDEPNAERTSYADVVLVDRLRSAPGAAQPRRPRRDPGGSRAQGLPNRISELRREQPRLPPDAH